MNFVDKNNIAAIVLAAGRGTRMGDGPPKVLRVVQNKPMLAHVRDRLLETGIKKICVLISPETGLFAEIIADSERLSHAEIIWVIQPRANGTGGAVGSAGAGLRGVKCPAYSEGQLFRGHPLESEAVLICTGDAPFIAPAILSDFISDFARYGRDLAVLGMKLENPTGYGRLVLDKNRPDRLLQIVEQKDAPPEIAQIPYCNSGIILAKKNILFEILSEVKSQNSQGEYYLTDSVGLAVERGLHVGVFLSDQAEYFLGVNTSGELAEMEKIFSKRSSKCAES